MAFEDDMIDAGFNDPMGYLERLMDEGDRIVQRQLERESEYSYTHESPYDGMSESEINRYEDQIQREILLETKRSVANLKIYANNNPEYQTWKSEADKKSLSAFWKVIFIFGWSWVLDKEINELDWQVYDEERFSTMLSSWKNKHIDKAPELMDYLYNCWLDDLHSFKSENSYSNVYDIMQFELKDYRSQYEEIFRKELKEKFGHEFIYQIIDDGVSTEDIESIIGNDLIYICYKNTGLSSLLKIKEEKPWCSLIDWSSFNLNQIMAYDFNREGWFSVNNSEKAFFNTIFLFDEIVKQRRLSIDLTWIDKCYFRTLSWIRRISKHQEERNRIISQQLIINEGDEKETIKYKKIIKQLINTYMYAIVSKYECENHLMRWDAKKGFTLSDVYNLVLWNTDHRNNRF